MIVIISLWKWSHKRAKYFGDKSVIEITLFTVVHFVCYLYITNIDFSN